MHRNRHWHSSRDANEKEIITEFEALGAIVIKLSSTARTGLPDLLVGHNGKLAFVEVKQPGEPLRADQERFRLLCERENYLWFLADHIDDALGITDCMRTGRMIRKSY